MIKKLSILSSEKLVQINIIEQEKKNIYAYGFELLISSVLGVASLIVVSIIFNYPFMWIPYLMAFIPLRIHAGGYHANTHFLCITSYIIIYTTILLVIKYCFIPHLFPFIISVISLTLIILFSPVETHNSPLKPKRRVICRNVSIIISILNLIFSVVIYFTLTNYSISVIFYFSGIIAATFLFVIAVIKTHFKRREKNGKKY